MSNRKAILGAIAVAFGAALILPVLFGEAASVADRSGGDPLRNLVYDFQTLIAGALAVLAAWWTIATMERTETAAANRHAEQVALTLRGDRLAVERAVYPQIDGLSGIEWMLQELKSNMLAQNTLRRQLQAIVGRAWLLESIFRDLQELLGREQLRDGSRFFDGSLTYKLHWLREQAALAANHVSELPAKGYLDPERVLADFRIYSSMSAAYGIIIDISNELPTVVDLLAETAERYGVKR